MKRKIFISTEPLLESFEKNVRSRRKYWQRRPHFKHFGWLIDIFFDCFVRQDKIHSYWFHPKDFTVYGVEKVTLLSYHELIISHCFKRIRRSIIYR